MPAFLYLASILRMRLYLIARNKISDDLMEYQWEVDFISGWRSRSYIEALRDIFCGVVIVVASLVSRDRASTR